MILEILAARAAARLASNPAFVKTDAQRRAIEHIADDMPLGAPFLEESRAYLGEAARDNAGEALRWRTVLRRFGLGEPGETALEFALARRYLPGIWDVIGQAKEPLTLENIAAWSGSGLSPTDDYEAIEKEAHKLARLVYLAPGAEAHCRRPFEADARLVDYLLGGDELTDSAAECCRVVSGTDETAEEQPVHEAYAQMLAQLCEREPRGWVQLCGEDAGEEVDLVRQLCARTGTERLMMDFGALCRQPDADRLVWEVRRELMLYPRLGACVHHITREVLENEELRAEKMLDRLLRALEAADAPLVLCTDGEAAVIPHTEHPVRRIELPRCTCADRIALWRWACGKEHVPDGAVDCLDAGSRFCLTRAETAKAARLIASRGESGPEALARACADVLPPPRQGSIQRVRVSYTLDDLKLPEEQKKRLRSLCAHVKYRHLVYDEWGMDAKYPYGRNVSALLVGPPGTGKTMAVHVLSNLLDLPLYQINLSQVVDKYIGETEKRLEEIFRIAEKSNSILFFDEADSIFGKRSEVNDAKDKYANTEVSYILQRIEQFDGIVILATNYRRNIDEAFMRRMRYLIEFQLPNEELRAQIWRSAFGKHVPTDGIDFDYLAHRFDLAGGAIKNIVLNAAFLAADEGVPVGMRHILVSLRDDSLKLGKTMLAQDFAEYAHLMRDT